MTDKQIAISRAGAKAAYLIERWKRGVGLMLMLALCIAASAIAVGIPMAIIGEVLDSPAWSSWRNIAATGGIFALPFFFTADAVLDMLGTHIRLQRGDDKIERQRRHD